MSLVSVRGGQKTVERRQPFRGADVPPVAAVVLGVLYPAFGVSLLLVLAVEAVLTRRRRRIDDDAAEVPVGAETR